MKSYTSVVVMLVLIAASATAPACSGPSLPEWTFIFYLDADNNLGVYAEEDLSEMMLVGSTGQVNVIVLYDTLEDPAHGYMIGSRHKDPLSSFPLEGIEVDMGDPETIRTFLHYVLNYYPAQHYYLCIWDHGDDFRGTCKDYNTANPSEPRGFLYHEELLPVLEQFSANASKNLDILSFDACIQGMIEVAYYYRNVADYLLGSENYITYHGYPYDVLLEQLTQHPETDPGDYAHFIIDAYVDAYMKPNGAGGGGYTEAFPCHSSINLSKVDSIVDYFDEFLKLIEDDIREYRGLITSARAKGILGMPIYGWDADIDLYTFISAIGSRSEENEVKTAATNALTAISDAVYMNCSHQYSVKSAYGLGIFFPSSRGMNHNKMICADYYFDIVPFALETRWGPFLESYLGPEI